MVDANVSVMRVTGIDDGRLLARLTNSLTVTRIGTTRSWCAGDRIDCRLVCIVPIMDVLTTNDR